MASILGMMLCSIYLSSVSPSAHAAYLAFSRAQYARVYKAFSNALLTAAASATLCMLTNVTQHPTPERINVRRSNNETAPTPTHRPVTLKAHGTQERTRCT